jgi:lipopolysaccharide transport system permease protein
MNGVTPFKEHLSKTWKDLISSLTHWRIFCLMGFNDIRKRYVRSKIGQFWLTLSLMVNIGTLGFVWAYLFKISVIDYLPLLATGIVLWTYVSGCILEGSNLYITSASYLQSLNLPKLTYLNSLLIRNIIVLLHNLIVLVPIFYFCSIDISLSNIFLSIFGFLLTILFLYPSVMILSLFSLRFRDFPNIVASLMQIVFYTTPIMWKIDLMPERIQNYLIFNPFAVFVSICRDPLFGINISSKYWLAAIVYLVVAWLIAFPFYSKFRSRIIYWL